jgi:hypothetical protein
MSETKKLTPVCYWCGKDFPTTIELGDELTPEEKAIMPDRLVVHYDPCPVCLEEWKKGRVFIQYKLEKTHEFQPPGLERPDGTVIFPTGRMYIISTEKAISLFGDAIQNEPISFLDEEKFEMVFDKAPVKTCFWCNKPFDGSPRDPKTLRAIENYDVCNDCAAKWTGKCVLIECDRTSDRQIEGVNVMCEGLPMHPTGRLMRIDPKEAKRLMGPEIGSIVYLPAAKFKILSGEEKPNGRKSVNVQPRKASSILARNDDE